MVASPNVGRFLRLRGVKLLRIPGHKLTYRLDEEIKTVSHNSYFRLSLPGLFNQALILLLQRILICSGFFDSAVDCRLFYSVLARILKNRSSLCLGFSNKRLGESQILPLITPQ